MVFVAIGPSGNTVREGIEERKIQQRLEDLVAYKKN
jgi:hypothetical protein